LNARLNSGDIDHEFELVEAEDGNLLGAAASPEERMARMGRKRILDPCSDSDEMEELKRQRTFVKGYCPTPLGTDVRSVSLVNSARKRTVIVELEEGMRMPEMKRAMDSEIESFSRMKCIETVQMKDVPKGANLVTSRWVLKRSKQEKMALSDTKPVWSRMVSRMMKKPA
jgi:hypothetical protein